MYLNLLLLLSITQEYNPTSLIVRPNNNIGTRKYVKYDVKKIKRISEIDNTELWELNDNTDLDSFMSSLQKDSNIDFVEKDYVIKLDKVVNDAFINSQWAIEHNMLNLEKAWDISTGSRDILVGVVDTGIDFEHNDLKNNMFINPNEIPDNGIDDDNNGYIDDIHGWNFAANVKNGMDDEGHGTHCAGIIGAEGNNNLGVAGVNWKISLVALKFFDENGRGYTSRAIKAIDYGTKMKIDILSNSWGGAPKSQALLNAIKRYSDSGGIFVSSAGNSILNNDYYNAYPCNYNINNIICVASNDEEDKLSYFSNYGKKYVHLAAPGSNILSTMPQNSYLKQSGTSMAAPQVTGAIALILSVKKLNANEIKTLLLMTVDRKCAYQDRVKWGGRLNVYKALKLLSDEPKPIRDECDVRMNNIPNAPSKWKCENEMKKKCLWDNYNFICKKK